MRTSRALLALALVPLAGCESMGGVGETYCGLSPALRCEVENLIELTGNAALDDAGFPVLVDIGPVCPDGVVCPPTWSSDSEAGDFTLLQTEPAETELGKALGR